MAAALVVLGLAGAAVAIVRWWVLSRRARREQRAFAEHVRRVAWK